MFDVKRVKRFEGSLARGLRCRALTEVRSRIATQRSPLQLCECAFNAGSHGPVRLRYVMLRELTSAYVESHRDIRASYEAGQTK